MSREEVLGESPLRRVKYFSYATLLKQGGSFEGETIFFEPKAQKNRFRLENPPCYRRVAATTQQ